MPEFYYFLQNIIETDIIRCYLLNGRQWARRPGFNPKLRHTKDFKNGTWYLLA